MSTNNSSAQGTIEYLVILAVVVVISLVIIGLFTNVFSSPSQQINESSDKFSVVSGGISVVESVIDFEGDSLIKLNNNSSDSITLTKISLGGVDNNFSEQLVGLDSKVFSLNALNSSCPCEEGQKNVKCELRVEYTVSGITKTEFRSISVQCVSDSVAVNLDVVVEPIVEITNCFDALDDPIQICTLSDLNRIREDLSASYILMNDIDATETISWDSGVGFMPIGFCATEMGCWTKGVENNHFVGNFNGNDFTVSNIVINYPSDKGIGLFGGLDGNVFNLNLDNIDVNGSEYVGGIAGFLHGKIYNSSATNITIRGNRKIGGIAGKITGPINESTGEIRNSFTSGNIIGTGDEKFFLGGIVGAAQDGLIENCYSSTNVTGMCSLGGIIGAATYYVEINNCYSTGTIINSGIGSGGNGGFAGDLMDSTVNNSFSVGAVSEEGDNSGFFGYLSDSTNSNVYWDTYLSGDSSCYRIPTHIDGNTGCVATNNQASLYYGANGIPFTNLNWSTDIWTARENDYPILAWQN